MADGAGHDNTRAELLGSDCGQSQVSKAATRDQLVRAQLVTSCREWGNDLNRCGRPAEFILWGKLFPAEALGPRCYDHAARHAGHEALGNPQWAITDLRPLLTDVDYA